METHEFDIAVNPDGTVRILVHGAKGPGCEQYVSVFQEIIQGKTTVERTSDYYAPPAEVEAKIDQKW
ncbi:MAG: DUF2997 domain-containing protein [Candidatus Adiutrix sp.]|nr:DUF2997 domain-containing protein [Candidatus Adiutrix sp.]